MPPPSTTMRWIRRALLERVGLTGTERRTWRQISGGEQRRLALALALVGRPQVAFLDEPSSGVDPQGRLVIREVVSAPARRRRHRRADDPRPRRGREARRPRRDPRPRIGRGGRQPRVAHDRGGRRRGALRRAAGLDTAALATRLGVPVTEVTAGEYLVGGAGTPALVATLTAWLAEHDLPLADLRAGRQRLEDVFLRLVSDPVAAPTPPGRRRRRGRP